MNEPSLSAGAPIGAIVYPPDHAPEALMAAFAAELARRGVRVGGLIQETVPDAASGKHRMEVVELDSGRRLSITQELGAGSNACALDTAALAEASVALRRGVENHVDLVFASKYAKAEQAGGGLAAEMLLAMSEGVPLLTAVSEALLDDWATFTGGLGELLPADEAALWAWWEWVKAA